MAERTSGARQLLMGPKAPHSERISRTKVGYEMAQAAHPKGVLLERAQKLGLGRPEFKSERTGPEHEPSFLADVIIDGEVLGTGQGSSKRTAEKNAAEEALAALDARESGPAPAAARSGSGKRSRGGGAAKAKSSGTGAASRSDGGNARAESAAASVDEKTDDEDDEEQAFSGPWPMFDDLLAAVLGVAERRVSSELRGEAARTAIRDFSLQLYKDLLADLGEVVEEDDVEGEEEEEG